MSLLLRRIDEAAKLRLETRLPRPVRSGRRVPPRDCAMTSAITSKRDAKSFTHLPSCEASFRMAVLLQIKEAYKSYGEQVLLDGAEATITDDAKVGFIGRNGA